MSVSLDTSYRSSAEDLALLPVSPAQLVGAATQNKTAAGSDRSVVPQDRESKHDHSAAPAGSPLNRQPPTGPHATHLARVHSSQLHNRFAMAHLRRMLRIALGPIADRRLPQEAAEIIGGFEGDRAPSIDEDQDGEHAFKRYIALREALDKVGEGPERAAVRTKIEAAIDALVKRHGRRIVGDLNITHSLEGFSKDIKDRDGLRKLYHDAVSTHQSIGQTFDCLLKTFGDAKLPEALRTLRLAIKEEMLVYHLASADPRRLGVLHSDLMVAIRLSSLIASCGLLQRKFPTLAKPRRAAEFTGKVLHVTEGPGSADQVRQICDVLLGDLPPETEETGSGAAASVAPPPAAPQLFERVQSAVRQFLSQQVPMEIWKSAAVRTAAIGYAAPVTGSAAPAA